MKGDSKKTGDRMKKSDLAMASDLAMTSERIDGILASEEDLVPSSGFLAAVMERVQEESAVPPPIPFPWKRAAPGIALACGVFGWGGYELVRYGISARGSFAPGPNLAGVASALHLGTATGRPLEQVGWVALALGLSWASWLFSRRLAGRG